MTRISDFKAAAGQQLSLGDFYAILEAEEAGAVIPDNGLCPYMQGCYLSLGLVRQHCSWNLDAPPTWQWCGGYRRRRFTTGGEP